VKRASYREGVRWIAVNDEPGCYHAEEVASFVSTLLVADLFDVEPARVARDVLREHQRREP
jgi:hypothetical protein